MVTAKLMFLKDCLFVFDWIFCVILLSFNYKLIYALYRKEISKKVRTFVLWENPI